jgi:hypothetical protein
VADETFGWAGFRPYSPELWAYLRVAWPKTPFLLCSATLNTASLWRIRTSLNIESEEVRVLSMSCDRRNIFRQARLLPSSVSLGWGCSLINAMIQPNFRNMASSLGFLFPLLVDEKPVKVQIFVQKKLDQDIIGQYWG